MRIDLEQFLALTVALGATGAVATAVYLTKLDNESTAAKIETVSPEPEYPEAAPDPAPTPVVTNVEAAPSEPQPSEPLNNDAILSEDLAEVPAPYSEGAWMSS